MGWAPSGRGVAVVSVVGLLVFAGKQGNAQIVTDGTVGPAKNLSGPNYDIGAELGTTRGANLFHSFQTFSIHSPESATFKGPDSIANVISRVTGGKVSNIDGELRSEVGKADFFFINPAGVVFGPNAKVNVPAGFHVSTADELRLDDGSAFSATNPNASTLSVAQPESFGYLTPQPTSLVLNGSRLEFAPTSRVSAIAGDVTIQDNASLISEGGTIRITAVGDSEATVDVATGSAASPPSGAIAISGSSVLDVSGTQGSETVALRGGSIEIADSEIAAEHAGKEDSVGQILLEADKVRVVNSDVHAKVSGSGRGNDILVVAEDLQIDATTAPDGPSRLTTRVMPEASGTAGDVRIEGDRVTLTNGGELSSIVLEGALGPGGTVEVRATDSISIIGSNDSGLFSGIATTTLSNGNAPGGRIVINSPTASLQIANGGFLQSGTVGDGSAGDIWIAANGLEIAENAAIDSSTFGSGNAGAIEIDAVGIVTINKSVLWASTGGTGRAGDILLTAGALGLFNGSKVWADTFGNGAAGNIDIEVTGSISLENVSSINAGTEGTGPGGQVVIRAVDLSLFSESAIIASTLGSGEGGNVTVDAGGSVLIDDSSTISSSVLGDGGSGIGGSVQVTAAKLEILDGGSISNFTLGTRDAGEITVSARDILINGEGLANTNTGVLSDALLGSGSGGDIRVTAIERLALVNGGLISSNTRTEETGGAVIVKAAELEINGGGELALTGIFNEALSSSGVGGDVQITATERLEINSGGQISNGTIGGQGNGGTVIVTAGDVVIDGSGQQLPTGILSTTTDGSGTGGIVQVTANQRLEIRSGGQISTSSQNGGGDAGDVTVMAPHLMLDGQGAAERTLQIGSIEITETDVTGIFSETQGTLGGALSGMGGDVRVTATQELELHHGGQISTRSGIGGGNAGSVTVKADKLIMESESLVTTSAIEADGGPITIDGGILALRDSQITTSVRGQFGNGGDITLRPKQLVLDTGFIQANTAALEARGGDIFVDTQALVASGGEVQVGGNERLTFQPGSGRNVIQAAAPGGEQGTITITAPELDISESLASIDAGFDDSAQLASDPCAAVVGKTASSLVPSGRGGMPQGPKEPAAVFFGGERLNRLAPNSTEPSRSDKNGLNQGPPSGKAGGVNSQDVGC